MRPPSGSVPRRALLAAAALLTQAPPAPARAWCGENFPSWAFYLKWDQSALPLQDNPKAGATSYRIVGDLVRESKAGVPPILVVGAPGIGYEYLENFEALTVSDRRVVFVALAGTAPASSSSSTFDTSLATPEAGAAQLAGVCKSLGLPAVHVVAHGLGAPAALRFAASSTSVVRSLTLSSPYGSVADLRQGALDLSSVKSLPQLAGLLLPTVSTNARDTCVAEARTAGGGPVLLPALTGASPFASLGGAKLGERLTALRGTGSSLPVLLASGGARDLVDADAWVDVPPWVSRKRFGGSGHLPFVEERDAFLLSCLEFLDGVDGKETNREFKFGDPVATIKEIVG